MLPVFNYQKYLSIVYLIGKSGTAHFLLLLPLSAWSNNFKLTIIYDEKMKVNFHYDLFIAEMIDLGVQFQNSPFVQRKDNS